MDYRIAMIQQHLSVCQFLVNQIVESTMVEYVGEKGSNQKPHDGQYSRYGYNPGGSRGSGTYNAIGTGGGWWNSTQSSTTDAWLRYLENASGYVARANYAKRIGFSVRCVRD
jgi:uncharacterized protein (TIGR02145 family)